MFKKPIASILSAFTVLLLLAVPALATHQNFITAGGTILLDGTEEFYYAGTNNYYLWYKPINCTPADEGCVSEVLDDAVAMNLSVIRTWGFGDGNNGGSGWNGFHFQPSPGVYHEATFQHFDDVLVEAHARGLRLIIPLVNNWDDFGGMNQYVSWCGGTVHDDFYTNSLCKELYKNYTKYFLNRVNHNTGVAYKDDPTIMAWELGNEPRAQTAGVTVLNNWVAEMSAWLKQHDSNHLVGTGSEGFYNGRAGFTGWMYDGSQGVDYIANHNQSSIDFATYHTYVESWNIDLLGSADWMNVHLDDARHVLGKPVIAGEFGKQGPTRNQYFSDWYNLILAPHHVNGDNFWILYNDDYTDYDSYGVYYPANASTVALITDHANYMNAKAAQEDSVDQVAWSDVPVSGTVTGNYTMTRTNNAVYESVKEIESGGNPNNRYSYLQHKWRFWVTPGSGATFSVKAYHSANSENDHFVFAYSTDDSTYTDMVTVTKTSDDGMYQSFALPSSLKGKVWVRVKDTDQTPGNKVLDTVFVDHMYIHSTGISLGVPDLKPVVDILEPADMATVSGTVDINATATDDHSVSAVEYRIDGGSFQSMTNIAGSLWHAAWDTTLETPGQHTITVRATDNASQTSTDVVTVTVDQYPNDADPAVSILVPADMATVAGFVTINASATDDVSVSTVEYRIDGGSYTTMTFVAGSLWTALWNSSLVADGNHQITVRATDSVGQTATDTITVNVDNVQEPTLHVQDIAMSVKQYGPKWQAEAAILIHDENSMPVSGVSVTTSWTGAGGSKTETVVTGANGIATSFSNKGPAGTYTVTVTDVVKSGYVYDPNLNVETSDSITTP